MTRPEQLQLEIPGTYSSQEVGWAIVAPVETKRRLGRKAVISYEYVNDENGDTRVKTIRADQISDLEDPELRRALRLQAAAEALGWFQTSSGSSEANFVNIAATDEDTASRFVRAAYSGTGKVADSTFMQDLHRAMPNYRENNSN